MTRPSKDGTVKAHCNSCGQETSHKVLHNDRRVFDDENVPDGCSFQAYVIHKLIACLGCEAVSMERAVSDSESVHAHSGDPIWVLEYFPPRLYRPVPKWLENSKVPEFIRTLVREVYIALQNDARSVAAMGIRAVLEHVMISKVGDQGTFKKNVDEFAARGFVASTQSVFLTKTLNIGDAAMHRGHRPDFDKLVTCMDVMENVLQSVYVLPPLAQKLGKGVPKRKRKGKKN
jgi:Domain of unknown function (DUF4145)